MLFPKSSRKPQAFIRKALTSPVFVDGVGRAGKVVVDLAIGSFERAEHVQPQPMMDSIFILNGMGLIDPDMAMDLLRKQVNNYLFAGYLGRNINTNLYDYSSVWNSVKPDMYLKRLATRDTPENFLKMRAAIRRERPILLLHTHEMLCDAEIFLKAFRKSRIVPVFRHPVDLVFSWHRKGFGERYGKDLRAGAHTFWGVTGPVPWWAFDWAEEYEKLPPLERVMRSVAVLNERYYDQMDHMPDRHRARLLPLCFEHFVTDPEPTIKALSEFLETRPTPGTWEVLQNQRVPRKLDRAEFKSRFRTIRQSSSKTSFEGFVEDCLRYEKRFKPGISIRRLG